MGVQVIPAAPTGSFYQPRKRAAGVVRSAFFVPDPPPNYLKSATNAAIKSGLRYERDVFDHMRWLYGEMVNIQPWLQYMTSGGMRTCQPDAVSIRDDKLVIFEVKKTHSLDSWFQLEKIYSPVMKSIFPLLPQVLVSVSSAYDPQIVWPAKLHYCDGFSDLAAVGEGHAALQWRKKDYKQ